MGEWASGTGSTVGASQADKQKQGPKKNVLYTAKEEYYREQMRSMKAGCRVCVQVALA